MRLPALFSVFSLAGAVLASSATAWSRTTQDTHYRFDQAWTAAIRLIRVDMGFRIVERDRETGFVVFQFAQGRRTVPGSIQILQTRVDGTAMTRVIFTVQDMPTYTEQWLHRRLAQKLRQEFGEPPVAAPETQPPTASNDPAQASNGSPSQGDTSTTNETGSPSSQEEAGASPEVAEPAATDTQPPVRRARRTSRIVITPR